MHFRFIFASREEGCNPVLCLKSAEPKREQLRGLGHSVASYRIRQFLTR